MVAAIVAAVLGWIFFWSGLTKLAQPGNSALSLVNFRIVKRYRRSNGTVLGAAECLIAIVAFASLSYRPLLTVSLLTFLVILTAISRMISLALARGESFACSCFGSQGEALSTRTLHGCVRASSFQRQLN